MNDRIDSSERKDHYGTGRQPWDDIVEAGWSPEFAAANVLKYLRRPDKLPAEDLEHILYGILGVDWERVDFDRAKAPFLESARRHSAQSARWYWDRLKEMTVHDGQDVTPAMQRARDAHGWLVQLLTREELLELHK